MISKSNSAPHKDSEIGEDLRAALLAYLDWSDDPAEAQMLEARRESYILLRQLEGCCTPLPGLYSEMLELPPGSTYAEAAAYLLAYLDDQGQWEPSAT